MLRQVALIFTAVLCAKLGLAARHLGDISLHGRSDAAAEAAAACEKMDKNDCKFGKKQAPKGFKCVWMYDCYKSGKKEAGPVGHPSECGAMKMQGIGVCSAVSLMPKAPPAPTDEEETELPSDEDIDEEMEDSEDSEEAVPEVDDAEPADTETFEEAEPVTPKLEEDNNEDEKEEDTTAEFDPDEEKPTYECGGASVHWRTCGTRSGCQYVKKADAESCGVEAWGCYAASDLTC